MLVNSPWCYEMYNTNLTLFTGLHFVKLMGSDSFHRDKKHCFILVYCKTLIKTLALLNLYCGISLLKIMTGKKSCIQETMYSQEPAKLINAPCNWNFPVYYSYVALWDPECTTFYWYLGHCPSFWRTTIHWNIEV